MSADFFGDIYYIVLLVKRGEGRRDWEVVLRYGVRMKNNMITLESIEFTFLNILLIPLDYNIYLD